MPVNIGHAPHTPITVPQTARPTVEQIKAREKAHTAKQQVLSLADEIRSWDQTPSDNWTRTNEVMVSDKDYHRNFFQKLFGSGKQISAIADYKNGELESLQASVHDAGTSYESSAAHRYSYQKLPDGGTQYLAPRGESHWSETFETGRNKNQVFYHTVHHHDVDYTTVTETKDGTLVVDLEARAPLKPFLH